MHSQPAPSEPRDTITGMDCLLLALSVLACTALTALVLVQAVATIHIYEGTTALLATLTILTGLGFITRVAIRTAMRGQRQMEERLMQRLAEVEAKFADECEDRVASAFVEHVATGRHLTSVSSR